MKQIVHIFGPSGGGVSTLGEAISRELGYTQLDVDDYFWMPTNPKFTTIRKVEERLSMLRCDIEKGK